MKAQKSEKKETVVDKTTKSVRGSFKALKQRVGSSNNLSAVESALEKQKSEVFKRARSLIKPLVPNKHKALIITAALVFGALVLFTTVFGLMIYRYKSDNPLVYQVARIIPYPVARINGEYVSYGDYLFELRPLKHFYSNPTGPAAAIREPVDFSTPEGEEQLAQLEQLAFEELKKKVVVRQLARQHHIEVTDRELNEAVQEAISREGGEEKFKEVISTYYNWTVEDFSHALKAQLLRRRLLPILSEEQRQKAESVLAEVRAGSDFAELAKKYSSDPGSSEKGGDLGTAPRGTYVSEFEDAAYSLAPGEVSDLVTTQFGFHIIKVNAKEGDKVHVSHILIEYADFETAIMSELEKAEVRQYIEIISPQQQEADQAA